MSKISMTTGTIQMNSTKSKDEYQRSISKPMHIAVVANFGGDKSCGDIARRPVLEVDRDNFEEVFEKLSPSLDLPISEKPIVFNEFDDLHPDYLVERVGVFEELRTLKRRLAKPALFEQAVRDIQSLLNIESPKDAPEPAQTVDDHESGDFMETLLANSQKNEDVSQNPLDDMNAFVHSIVSPYVEPLSDPRLDDMLQAVDSATANLLRKIMHASQFQVLEAAWRSLYLLVRSIETDSKLKIFIVDVSHEELQKDLASGAEFSQSQMYKLLLEKRQVSGATPFSVINVDTYVSDNLTSVRIAESFASIAKSCGGLALLGGASRLAGCVSFGDYGDSEDWTIEPEREFSMAWKTFRESAASQHLAVLAPRFMIRLPYGASTSPIESFKFEELSTEYDHDNYLWGNSTFIFNILLAQSYTHQGWDFSRGLVKNKVEGLPLHVYQRDGESMIKPCAELMLTDRDAKKLSSQGLLSVRSISNSNSVLISDWVPEGLFIDQ